jgi:hypothetical protein
MSKATTKQSAPEQIASNQASTNLTSFNDVVVSICIIKVASCTTNSGKSTLTYHVASTSDNEINFRITGNTGGGFFSPECVSYGSIQPAMEKATLPLISFPFIKLYKGKSTKTPALLMAAIKNEGLVRNLEGKIRGYELLDNKFFMDEMKVLIAAGVNLKMADIAANFKTSYAINKSKAALTSKTQKNKGSIEANSVR